MTHYPWTNLRRPHADEVVSWLCRRCEINPVHLIAVGHRRSLAGLRRYAAYLLLTECGMSRVEIAMYFNRGTSTIHAWVKQYLAECRREAA